MTADEWNERHRIGTDVSVRLDSGKLRRTRTRSAAWSLGDHTDVILLDGITGCYLLDRVTPVKETAP